MVRSVLVESPPDRPDPIELQRQLGQVVRERRLRRELTQRNLATFTGLSRSYIARIEAGKANPTVETLLSLAEWLVTGTERDGWIERPSSLLRPAELKWIRRHLEDPEEA